MKRLNKFSTGLLAVALLTGFGSVSSADEKKGQMNPIIAQRKFATPEDAVKALQVAVEARDNLTMTEVFGPDFRDLLTGDKVQDANNMQKFATAVALGCKPVQEADDKITIEIGTNGWPMPIPLVRTSGQWYFDTAAGKEEIINRHIGKDELHAIGVCRAYVDAQHQYAAMRQAAGEPAEYAQKFKSSPGKKDGLYWPSAANEPQSPFGPLVAEAHAEGYHPHHGSGPHPFHGYYFRILTRQGDAAPGGKMDYINHGKMTGGFTLVAYPVQWDRSGIMTFIVNQDGKVYQRNLGEKTLQIARSMKEYNPDSEWTLVEDKGVTDVVSEK